MTLTDEEITAISLKFSGVHNFARAIEARVLEELRKQEEQRKREESQNEV